MESKNILQFDGISVRFGGVTAVDNVSFHLSKGELLGLIGPNGAGKTTIMRAITGVVKPQEGTVTLDGQPLNGKPIFSRIRMGLGLSQQLVRPFKQMTVIENVAFAAGASKTEQPFFSLFKVNRTEEREKALSLLKLVGIEKVAEASPANLPLGFLKRLELARALALEPKLLLLDEPLAGLNHIEAEKLADVLLKLNQQGQSIILIEHNLKEVMRICGRLVVVDNGHKLHEGDPRKVMENPAVRDAYLGKE